MLRSNQNKNHFTFGYRNSTSDWRWSFYINWSDGRLYFDSGEVCCAPNRSIVNGANINQWRQYTFIRGASYKTIRINGATTGLNNSPAASTIQTGGQFYIGHAFGSINQTFNGFMSEVVMFPNDLPISEVAPVEDNQVDFWRL